MSLATRCTACGTVFRVVEDQLRVSEGWVRCGRCAEVFNAIESLVELDGMAAGPEAAGSSHGQRVMDDLARVAQAASAASAAPRAPSTADRAGFMPAPATGQALPPDPDKPVDAWAHDAEPGPLEPVLQPTEAHGDAMMAHEVQANEGQAPEPAGRDLRAGLADARAWGARAAAVAAATATPTDAADMNDDGDDPATSVRISPDVPAFVRKAERAARWRRPGVRAALSLLALLAAVALALQVALTQHDLLAARWPVLKPAMERLCALSGCQLGLPRRIASLTVDSSGLVRAGPSGAYRLSLVLRNADVMTLRLPSVDLSLTDAQGRTLARRVLDPADLGSTQDGIAAGAELPLAVSLRTRDPAVVGYTIEIFYP